MSIIFITCCSRNKVPGGNPYDKYRYDFIPDIEILRIRNEIRRQILKGEIQGNLRSALFGQDFGGTESGLYLPAQERYAAGAFMSSLYRALGNDKDLQKTWLDENPLFFISGLYGVVRANEPIQNYDVHLEETKGSWNKNILTRYLMNMIKPAANQLILDCTADFEYSQMIDWGVFEEDNEVLHVTGKLFEGSQIRSAAGELAANSDGRFIRERIRRGDLILKTDADIKFVPSKLVTQTRDKAEKEARIRRERVGIIAIDEKEYASFKAKLGHLLNDFFEFIPITSKDGLKNAKDRGCQQCICRITLPKHKSYQATFGNENIQRAMAEAGLEPVIFKNGYSNLRLKLFVN